MEKFILYFVIYLIIRINGKSITIHIDAEDILKIINNLANFKIGKIPTARSDITIKSKTYRNPYHPEDGMNETEKESIQSYEKSKSNKIISVDKKNDEINVQIDRDNMEFLQSANNISDDELTDNNTYNDLRNNDKYSVNNLTLKPKTKYANY